MSLFKDVSECRIREFCLIIISNNREMTKCFLVCDETHVPRLIYYNIFYLLIFSEQNRQPGSVYLYCTKERYDFVVINLMYTYIFFKIGNTGIKSEGINYTGKSLSCPIQLFLKANSFPFIVFPNQ